jgi:GAF domain-containing protein
LQQFTLQNRDAPTIFSDINNDSRFDHAHDHHAIFPDTTSGISIALISDIFSEQDPSTKKRETKLEKLREGGEEYKEAIIGRFFVYFIDRHEFSDEELWYINNAADWVADAVNRHKLRSKLSESDGRFKYVILTVIKSLLNKP